MFYLQNCEKKDINGHYLIYDLVKDNGIIRKETFGYTGYRCSISSTGRYTVNSTWNSTTHNPKTKKWILLAINLRKYNDLLPIKDKK